MNPVGEGVLQCPTCGEEYLPGERYCESCGADLTGADDTRRTGPPATVTAGEGLAPGKPAASPAARTCASCGGTIAADGYCGTCGAPAVRERDHWSEQPVPWIAAVCDRGVKHSRNEDAVAVAGLPEPGSRAVLVVCDGVSTAADSDLASLSAARAARDVLLRPTADTPSVAGRIRAWSDQLDAAAAAADDAVAGVVGTGETGGDVPVLSPPSCTFVAAVVDGPLVVVGSVGDSRAYWFPVDGTPQLLTTDDSWAAEQIAAGMPREQAEALPQAHAITRWLGTDSPDVHPRVVTLTPTTSGWLLVCSDGLWNYCSSAAALGALVAQTSATADDEPLRLAGALVDWAKAQGGHDNITVALARIEPADQPEQTDQTEQNDQTDETDETDQGN